MTTTAPAAPDLTNQSLDQPITFEDGLVGCNGWKRFVLLEADGEDQLPVAVLQSLDDPDVSLLVTNPVFLDPAYNPRFSAEDRRELGLEDNKQATLFCTLSASHDGWITANLLGPLAVNPRTGRAKQLVLADSSYTTQHPVAPLAINETPECSS